MVIAVVLDVCDIDIIIVTFRWKRIVVGTNTLQPTACRPDTEVPAA